MEDKLLTIDPAVYNNTCYIIGGGPSLKDFDWSLLNNKFVIAVNKAYDVLPDAQIVYFTDDDWYEKHKLNLINHSGIKIKGSLNIQKYKNDDIIQFQLTRVDGLELKPGCLAHGQNSTYAAINLAGIHLKFKTIYLLGIDMGWGVPGDKSTSHWHSDHIRIDSESIYATMMRNYATIVKPLANHGIAVINVNNPNTTNLKVFPIQTVQQVFK